MATTVIPNRQCRKAVYPNGNARYKTSFLIVGVSVPILLICSMTYFFSRLPSGPEALSIAIPAAYRCNIVLRHKDGTTSEHNGIELYKEHYLSSWQDCAKAFIADRQWGARQWGTVKAWQFDCPNESDLGAPWIVDAPDEINDARRDGWRACQRRIETLLDLYSDDRARSILETALSRVTIEDQTTYPQ